MQEPQFEFINMLKTFDKCLNHIEICLDNTNGIDLAKKSLKESQRSIRRLIKKYGTQGTDKKE